MAEEAASLLDGEGGAAGEAEEGAVEISYGKAAINSRMLPLGTWLLEKGDCCYCHPATRRLGYKTFIYILTFCCYTSYHLSRKPFSVVKPVLCPSCAKENGSGWYPFDDSHGQTLMGAVDYSWLFAYALAMYFSGLIGDRVNLRYFLTFGMLGSSISVAMLGVAYFLEIHHIWYFILIQLFGGVMQSTGWPGVVAVMGHWFGKQRRGFIMGLWNAHTSVGNILGTIIPSFWARSNQAGTPWGWSFLVPAFIIAGMAMVIFLFLVIDPTHVGLEPPVHHLEVEELDEGEGEGGHTVGISGGGNGHVMVESSEEEEEEDNESINNSPLLREEGVDNTAPLRKPQSEVKAIGFFGALKIPGVIEYSLALFFNKLVSYTFLFWLPLYVKFTHPHLSNEQSDWLSTLFDVGGIIGGIVTGVVSDFLGARAVTCVFMLVLAIPSLFFLEYFGNRMPLYIIFLLLAGATVNGPYAIITTAVSSDLGTHKCLKGKKNAKATVTAIIDGTGSLGAAFGPLLVGVLTDHSSKWKNAFYLLMASIAVAAMFLTRLVFYDIRRWYRRCRTRLQD